METFSALLALCAGNSPVTGEFPSHMPMTRSFDLFFVLRLNKRLSKQPWRWGDLRRHRAHYDVIVMVDIRTHIRMTDFSLIHMHMCTHTNAQTPTLVRTRIYNIRQIQWIWWSGPYNGQNSKIIVRINDTEISANIFYVVFLVQNNVDIHVTSCLLEQPIFISLCHLQTTFSKTFFMESVLIESSFTTVCPSGSDRLRK